MEVVATVSSIAGIASLVGQSISGICKLYNFFQHCKNVSKTVARFLAELTGLKQMIQEVESIILTIGESLDTTHNSILTSLKFHLEDCTHDIEDWFKTAQKSSVSDKSRYKAFFKRILATTKNNDIKDVFKQINSHRQGISLSLSATGRLLDVENLTRSTSLLSKVDEVLADTKLTTQALKTLDERLGNSQTASSPSLSDIASQLSKIESLVSAHYSQGSNRNASKDMSQSSQGGNHRGETSRAIRVLKDPEEYFTSASFVGQPPIIKKRPFHCTCCRQREIFESKEGLRAHQEQRPFSCYACEFRYKTAEQCEDHMRSNHYGIISWSCGSLNSWQNAYSKSSVDRTIDCCSYCGDQFARSGPGVLTESDCESYMKHLSDVHEFGNCDPTRIFLDSSYFREHLALYHHTRHGNWTHSLLESCVIYRIVDDFKPRSSSAKNVLSSSENGFLSPEIRKDLMTKYGAFLFGTSGTPMSNHVEYPQELMEYIRFGEMILTQKSDQRTLDVLFRRIDRSQNKLVYKELVHAKRVSDHDTTIIADALENARQKCWAKGFELDMIDELLGLDELSSHRNQGLERDMMDKDKQENLEHIWNDLLRHNEIRFWSTKKDRINVWMLQNLAASPDAAKYHRSFLENGSTIEESDWARLVLKFWLIDGEALDIDSETSSTTGAMDSNDRCQSNAGPLQQSVASLRRKNRENDVFSFRHMESRKKIKIKSTTKERELD